MNRGFDPGLFAGRAALLRTRTPHPWGIAGPGSVGHIAGSEAAVAANCRAGAGAEPLRAQIAGRDPAGILGSATLGAGHFCGTEEQCHTDGRRMELPPHLATSSEKLPMRSVETRQGVGAGAELGLAEPVERRLNGVEEVVHVSGIGLDKEEAGHDLTSRVTLL